jgi:hypothetical protein
MRQQVAKLVYDSARTSELTGMRGGIFEQRSVGFLGQSMTVEMLIDESAGDFYCVSGQVLDRQTREPRAGARLTLGAHGEAATSTDDYGEFTIGGQVTTETQILIVHSDEVDLVCRVPDLY